MFIHHSIFNVLVNTDNLAANDFDNDGTMLSYEFIQSAILDYKT